MLKNIKNYQNPLLTPIGRCREYGNFILTDMTRTVNVDMSPSPFSPLSAYLPDLDCVRAFFCTSWI